MTVFLVHGGGGRAGQFKHQIQALESTVNVVAFDFLGHGDSPNPNRPELYTENEHFEDLLVLYERHKQERNVFIAHCYGSIHTLRLLQWLSERERLGEVAAIVLLALGSNSPVPSGALLKLPAFLLEWLRPLARSSSNATIFTPHTDPALVASENSISNGNRMYVMKVLGADCASQERWDGWLEGGREAIAAGGLATALVCGEWDGVFSVESSHRVKEMFSVGDDAFHVVKEAGHLFMLEKPSALNEIIKTFLTSQAGVTGFSDQT